MKNKTIISVDSWLPVFPGFYRSPFDLDELFFEFENIREVVKDQEMAEAMIENYWGSARQMKEYAEYMEQVARFCTKQVCEELKRLGFLEEYTYQEIHSPREYNFSNDSIHVEYKFSAKNLDAVRKYIHEEKEEEWKQYLKDTYTSYSGFISHHSNDADNQEWDVWVALNDTHNAGAILSFICEQHGLDMDWLYEEFCIEGINYQYYIDVAELQKECIEKEWYIPVHYSLLEKIEIYFSKFCYRKVVKKDFATQHVFETPRQSYIIAFTRVVSIKVLEILKLKRWFWRILFAKRKEKKEDQHG